MTQSEMEAMGVAKSINLWDMVTSVSVIVGCVGIVVASPLLAMNKNASDIAKKLLPQMPKNEIQTPHPHNALTPIMEPVEQTYYMQADDTIAMPKVQ